MNEQIEMAKRLVEILGDEENGLEIHPLWLDDFQNTVCIAQQLWAEKNGLT